MPIYLHTIKNILGFLKSNPLFYIYLGSKKYYDTYFTIIWITPMGIDVSISRSIP